MKDEKRTEPIPSNGAELVGVNPKELLDEASLGSIQITVFIMITTA